MKYRIKKETKPNLGTYGKYKAVAVHERTISSKEIAEEAGKSLHQDGYLVEAVMTSLSKVISRHLREGDKVRLKELGLLKLEIESEKVASPHEFVAKKHIRGVRLHFLPESENGSPQLYKDITFRKEKTNEDNDI